MDTVKEFFAAEIHRIDRSIKQIQEAIDGTYSGDNPSANHTASMRAMLDIKCRQRRTIETLEAQSHDLQSALVFCRLHLMAAEEAHMKVASRQGARDLRQADAWWDTLNDIEFLAHLSSELRQAIEQQKPRQDTHNGKR